MRSHALLSGRQDKGTTEFVLLIDDGVPEFFQEPNDVLTNQKAEFHCVNNYKKVALRAADLWSVCKTGKWQHFFIDGKIQGVF